MGLRVPVRFSEQCQTRVMTTVRPYEDRDSDGYWRVRDMTYNEGRPTLPENRKIKTTRAFVAERAGQIAGVFNVLDLTCTGPGNSTLRCAGIAGVAVSPEFRHLGIGSDMMSWSIPFLRSEGYEMASLYGFRESFYRKFGYEVVGLRLKITCPSPRLPRLKPELPVKALSWEEFETLKPCHDQFCNAFLGMNRREDLHWRRVLNENKAIYAAGSPVEGYAIIEHKVDFWEPQWVNEVAWSSERGYRSIMALLSQVAINKSSLQWWEPWPSPYMAQYQDAGVTAESERAIMYRVLDVDKCLALAKLNRPGSMGIDDPLVPENRKEGSTMLSIGEFTQLFLGQAIPGFEAHKGWPSAPAYCLEFF